MDVRNIFKAASVRLMADFEETAEVSHQGGKGSLREDALTQFMVKNLPARYGVGRGEVINHQNYTSGQLDLIIHDPLHCPAIITSPSHSVFPIESVYAAVSIKSTLGSPELKDAYANIVSFQKVVLKEGFQVSPMPGMMSGVAFPKPFTAIIAYRSGRSLEAIRTQIELLDNELEDINELSYPLIPLVQTTH